MDYLNMRKQRAGQEPKTYQGRKSRFTFNEATMAADDKLGPGTPRHERTVAEKRAKLGAGDVQLLFPEEKEQPAVQPKFIGVQVVGMRIGTHSDNTLSKPRKYISDAEIARSQVRHLKKQQFGTDIVTNAHLDAFSNTTVDTKMNESVFERIRDPTRRSHVEVEISEYDDEDDEEHLEEAKKVTEVLVQHIDDAENKHAHAEDEEFIPAKAIRPDYDHDEERRDWQWDI